jgi:uncharacterized protein YggL (DUF469 family)
MNKRLRKKRHTGEFKELGFAIVLKLRPELTEPELNAWLLDLIETVERLNLGIGGGGQYVQEFFCTKLNGRGSVSLEEKEALNQWLTQDRRLESFHLGELEDVWYPKS